MKITYHGISFRTQMIRYLCEQENPPVSSPKCWYNLHDVLRHALYSAVDVYAKEKTENRIHTIRRHPELARYIMAKRCFCKSAPAPAMWAVDSEQLKQVHLGMVSSKTRPTLNEEQKQNLLEILAVIQENENRCIQPKNESCPSLEKYEYEKKNTSSRYFHPKIQQRKSPHPNWNFAIHGQKICVIELIQFIYNLRDRKTATGILYQLRRHKQYASRIKDLINTYFVFSSTRESPVLLQKDIGLFVDVLIQFQYGKIVMIRENIIHSIYQCINRQARENKIEEIKEEILNTPMEIDTNKEIHPKKNPLEQKENQSNFIMKQFQLVQEIQDSNLQEHEKETFKKSILENISLQPVLKRQKMDDDVVGWVYATFSPSVKGVKIGYTDGKNIWDRIRKYNINVEKPYEIIAHIRCKQAKTLEKYVHNIFKNKNLNDKELFDVNHDTIRNVFCQINNYVDDNHCISYENMHIKIEKKT